MNELLDAEHGMIGDSERMKEVYRFISRVGPGERPVLILGPSGTGKELVAYIVRELENAIEWAISMGATAYILPEDLPKEIRPSWDLDPGKGLYEREFAAFQKSLFERMLRETVGNRAEAARRLRLASEFLPPPMLRTRLGMNSRSCKVTATVGSSPSTERFR